MCLTVSNKIITIIQHPHFTQPVLSLDKGWMVVKWNEKFFTRFKIMSTEIMQFTIVKAATPCHTVLQVTPSRRPHCPAGHTAPRVCLGSHSPAGHTAPPVTLPLGRTSPLVTLPRKLHCPAGYTALLVTLSCRSHCPSGHTARRSHCLACYTASYVTPLSRSHCPAGRTAPPVTLPRRSHCLQVILPCWSHCPAGHTAPQVTLGRRSHPPTGPVACGLLSNHPANNFLPGRISGNLFFLTFSGFLPASYFSACSLIILSICCKGDGKIKWLTV